MAIMDWVHADDGIDSVHKGTRAKPGNHLVFQ